MVLFPLSSMCRAASTCTPRSLNWAARKMAQNKKVTLLLLCIAHLLGGATVEAGAGNNIEQTPSWKIGIFFGFFLVLSVLLEIGLEVLEEYLEHHHLHGVMMTVEKIKEELMLMGFISDHRGDNGELDWHGEHVNVVGAPEHAALVKMLHQQILDYIRLYPV